MNKLADARSVEAFEKKTIGCRLARNHPLFAVFLGEVYFLKSQKDYFLRENQSFRP
jgi:hypothetical protein